MAIIACSLQNFLSKSDKGFFLLIERNNFEQSKTEIEKPRDRPPQTSPINDHQASKKKKKLSQLRPKPIKKPSENKRVNTKTDMDH